MKNNRLERVLYRNQRSALSDLALALLFLVAVAVTGIAMKGAVGQLI